MSTVVIMTFMMVALQWTALTGASTAAAGPTMTSDAAVGSAMEPAEQPVRTRFRGMDRNGDGIITRAEWQGSAQSFRVHDWNGDGVLSGDEILVGGRRNPEPDFDPRYPDEFSSWTEAGFANLDRNRDGRITANEWRFDEETFWRVDRNGDGALSRAEFLNANVDDDRTDRFEYLDQNNNNRIERREWHGSAETFDWLDRNRDNVLSRAEIQGNRPAQTANADRFIDLDFDRNGVITMDEWAWSRASFDRLDVNNDGRLTRAEYSSVSEGGTTASTQSIRVPATEQWVDTGLSVGTGDVITIRADGSVRLSDNPNDVATPAGSRTGRTATNAPVPSASAGALLMRIGNSAPMVVGDRNSISAPANGRIYLGVNDDHMLDNAGDYRVAISVRGR